MDSTISVDMFKFVTENVDGTELELDFEALRSIHTQQKRMRK